MNDPQVLDWLDSPEGEGWLNSRHKKLRQPLVVAKPIYEDDGIAFLWYL